MSVLVVDDDDQMLKTAADILRLRGYAPVTASTARRALELAAQSPSPAIALVDLRLPDMDGIVLVAHLRAASELTEVVILTGNASVDSAVRALREHSYDYLIKPVQPEQLLDSVGRAGERWQRRRAEAELRATEARYRHLVETAHEGVWTIDADGRTDYVNPRMAAMLGYRTEEMLGRPLFDFMDAEAGVEAARNVERRRQGVEELHEFRLRRKDGTELWTLMSTSPILGGAGEYLGALAMVTEITERKRLEDQLRQSQKLEAVGQLAGGVAHDFNNMLTAIKSYAQLVAEAPGLTESVREDVREIDRAADRAAALTRQLLAFSRRQLLQPKVLELNAVVAGVEPMLRRLLLADVKLVAALEPALAPVLADPGQIEQVLLNLVVNARDAMPEGGTLTIGTANVQLDGDTSDGHAPVAIPPGRYVMLAVTDTGCGMDASTQERIFEPFFTTKERGKGTGLGLSTVYGIVKQSGGYIWVYSEPGHGTAFKVYLPRADGAERGAERQSEHGAEQMPPTRRGAETILLVEDEDSVRAVARRVLEREGYTVLEAVNGSEALAVCDARRAGTHAAGPGVLDLVVTDMVMPEMSGHELGARIREHHPEVRLLFMSGYTRDAALRQSFLQEGDAFLEKPFTIDALARAVREALDHAEPPEVSAGEAHLRSPLTDGVQLDRSGHDSR